MTGPIASIVVSLVLTFGFLFGTGAFKPATYTYATAKFEGGYQKIGVINREEVFTEVRVEINGDKIMSGDFEEVIAKIRRDSKETGGLDKTIWKDGVEVKAKVGIRWTGSESSFKLTTESLNLISTNAAPLKPFEVIDKLTAMQSKNLSTRVETAKQTLEFGAAPTESFLLSKVLSAFQK